MKQKTIHLNKETLQKVYEISIRDCESVQYLIDRARSRLTNRDIPKTQREEARISYAIAKAYQDVDDGWYDCAIQRLEFAIASIKRDYNNRKEI